MVLHPSAADPNDPARALEEAGRAARASSHSRRLDTAVQSALNAFADALAKMVDHACVRDAELADARARIAALEAREATRVHHDP